jgi:tetratricopeptide (TPR) repeat protein
MVVNALANLHSLQALAANNSEQRKPAQTAATTGKQLSDAELLKKARYNKIMFEDEESIQNYTKYLTAHPDDEAARFERSEEYRNEHRFDECISDLNKLITSKNPAMASKAATQLGKLYQSEKNYKEAIKAFKIARKMGVPTLLTEISDCARLSGDNETALQYSNLIIKSGDNFAGRKHRADAYMAMNQPRMALVDLSVLIAEQRDHIAHIDKEGREIYPTMKRLVDLLTDRAKCYDILKATKEAQADKVAIQKMQQEVYSEVPFLVKDKH